VTFSCRVDDGDWQACSSPMTIAGLSSGEHGVEVRAIDATGTKSKAASSDFTV
jgi:hypothetical protein